MKYNTIIFDLDGTLLDSLADLCDSVNSVLQRKGYPLRSLDEIQSFIGNGVQMLMTRALPGTASQADILRSLDLFHDIYSQNMCRKTKPYGGVKEMLQWLKRHGLKTGVVSNKTDQETKKLCRYFFGNDIDVAIGDNAERKKKPAPDNLYAALKELNSEKATTLYIGDSNVDAEAAKNAGLQCAGAAWGYRSRESLIEAGADYIIDRPIELIRLLERFSDGRQNSAQ